MGILGLLLSRGRCPTGPSQVRLNYAPLCRATHPYFSRGALLTQGELAFYRRLRTAVGRRYHISMKVRLADVIDCRAGPGQTEHGWRIAQKHLDFVLLNPGTTEIVLAIELNDRSHLQPKRRQRDTFVNDALHAAGVPLLTFTTSHDYCPSDIAGDIKAALSIYPKAIYPRALASS